MTVEFVLLIIGAYLLGSVPSAYLAGKWSREIDIRQYGSRTVGASNLLMLTSKRIAIPVIIFDSVKGMLMVGAACLMGLGIAQQVTVGLAAILGHNWPVFLRFYGGRGVITSIGVAFILPLINGLLPWTFVSAYAIALTIIAITQTTPLGVGIGMAALPLFSWLLNEPPSLTLGLMAIFMILVIRRLTAPRAAEFSQLSRKQLFVNRLLFDRDIKDKEAWMNRSRSEISSSKQAKKRKG
ncbi:glycerol-3-phosphate acyltransferase [Chloroflexota bacterium]